MNPRTCFLQMIIKTSSGLILIAVSKKEKIERCILSHLITLSVETIDENSSCQTTWISQFQVDNHNLKKWKLHNQSVQGIIIRIWTRAKEFKDDIPSWEESRQKVQQSKLGKGSQSSNQAQVPLQHLQSFPQCEHLITHMSSCLIPRDKMQIHLFKKY